MESLSTVATVIKRNFWKMTASIFVILLVVILILLPQNAYNSQVVGHRITRFTANFKYILLWNEGKTRMASYDEGQLIFVNQRCSFMNCYITSNKTLLDHHQVKNFDAVVFDIHAIQDITANAINISRSPEQKFIFRSMVSSENNPICNSIFDDFFNWTWTYRLNSDIPQPFYEIYDYRNRSMGPRRRNDWLPKQLHVDQYDDIIKGKYKAVAWIAKCNSRAIYKEFFESLKRELELNKLVIDTYGCPQMACNGSMEKCFRMIEKEYFFQLVLEDTVAEDYVTEKIVKAMEYITVPIVFGNTDYSSFLPPSSFINAKGFDIKQLVGALGYLMKNPNMYAMFFDWKIYYHFGQKPKTYICDLCTKLNSVERYQFSTYYDFRKWWNPQYNEQCTKMFMHDTNK